MVLEETFREIGKDNQGERSDLSPNLEISSDGRTDWTERIANEMDNVSKNTIRKGVDVHKYADPDQDEDKYDVPDVVRNVAQVQVERMDEGKQSFTPL